MENENTNESEFNSEIEFSPCTALKANVCVVCASILETEVSSDPGESTEVPPFQEQIPIYSDRFLEGLSVFCETLNIDTCYNDYEKWFLHGGDENFVQYVCCRACYSRFAQLVTLQELIVATQASLRSDVRAIQRCVVESQEKDVEFSHNTCHRFREDVILNFETVTDDVEAPEFHLTSEVEDEVGNIAVESDGDYYDDSSFVENVAQTQEPVSEKGERPLKPKASSAIDEVVNQNGLPLPENPIEVSNKIDEVIRQYGFSFPPENPAEVSSTVEGERDHGTSPKPPAIVSISNSDRRQNKAPLKSSLTSHSETFQVKRKRGRPRKNDSLNSQATQESHVPVQDCSGSLNNESIVKKKRGRPRKSESISPRSQKTPVENFTPVQGSSCLPDNVNGRSKRTLEHSPLIESMDFLSNSIQDTNYEEVPVLSRTNEGIFKKKRGRPRKSESIGHRSQTTRVEILTPVQGSSCLPDNVNGSSIRRLEHCPSNESEDFLSNTTQDINYEEVPVLSRSNENVVESGGERLILDSDTPRTVVAKRGRGRPRKNESFRSPQTKPEENLLDYLNLKANDNGAALSSNNDSIIKRKRGRPRKEKESPDLNSDTALTVAAKRKRGRPRKDDSARLNSGRGNLKRDIYMEIVNFKNQESLFLDQNVELGKLPGSS